MKQFKTIFAFEFRSYLKNKIFVGVTIILVAAIAVVMFLPNIKDAFFSDSSSGPRPVMLVVQTDDSISGTYYADSYFENAFPGYEIKSVNYSEDEIKNAISSGEAECAFALEGLASYKYYTNNLSITDNNTAVADELLTTAYRMTAMSENGLSAQEITTIMSATVTGEAISIGKTQSDTFLYTYIMIVALYVVIMLYGQMVATGVASEKSSRAMEVLITSTSPISMMFGKVMAACTAGLCQIVAIFGSALIFYNINSSAWNGNLVVSSIFNIPPALFAYMLLFFLLGFLIYAFLYGAIGSTASKLEDINTAVLPLTYLFIIALLVVMNSITSGSVDNIVIKICSYIPFTSPMAMFTRIAMSNVPTYEIIISIVILIGSVIGIGILSAKIYRVGVLMYGTKPNIFSIIKKIFTNK